MLQNSIFFISRTSKMKSLKKVKRVPLSPNQRNGAMASRLNKKIGSKIPILSTNMLQCVSFIQGHYRKSVSTVTYSTHPSPNPSHHKSFFPVCRRQ